MVSSSSHHMKRLRSIFLTFSEINTDFYIGYGTNTRQVVRRFGYVIFQLELGGIMGIENMLYVPYFKVNLLSISSFEDEGYVVGF